MGDLIKTFGFSKLGDIFTTYLNNTAAAVRNSGTQKVQEIVESLKSSDRSEFLEQIISKLKDNYNLEKKGYNYRICCLHTYSAIMPYMDKDQITANIVPILKKASVDKIPNVKFCVARLIKDRKNCIDPNVFSNHLV